MKICAITTWPPHPDGISLYSAQLYGHIGEKIEVKILANIVDLREEKFGVEKKCEVVRCWKRGSVTYPFKIFSRVLAEKPDIIHLQHGWFLYGGKIASLLFPLLLILLRLTGKPIIVTTHTIIGEKPRLHEKNAMNLLARMAVIFLTRIIVKLSTRVIVHNNLMRETLKNLYSLHRECWKILVIPHGVKEPAEKPRKIFWDRRVRILSLGFVRKSKGIEYLIEAFKTFSAVYPESALIIVGGRHAHDDEKYFELLRKRLRDRAENIIFTGFVDEETLDKLVWNSEIIVLPSVGGYFVEASGSLARVAMYGKPIICGKVPKFRADLEDGKDCIMVEFNNPRKLADALLLLANDANLRGIIGRNLRNKFKDRVWSKVAEQHINLFRSVVTGT
ncbi:MAG: glycosyltransferase [Candidatus Bathyarchaeota archaeon]|nr:glycosyltransferase [Candidatus Bathyarchaeota archaeon]